MRLRKLQDKFTANIRWHFNLQTIDDIFTKFIRIPIPGTWDTCCFV